MYKMGWFGGSNNRNLKPFLHLHVLRHVPDWRATLALQMPSTNSHVAANLQKVIHYVPSTVMDVGWYIVEQGDSF